MVSRKLLKMARGYLGEREALSLCELRCEAWLLIWGTPR
jgi:hypothetical protein